MLDILLALNLGASVAAAPPSNVIILRSFFFHASDTVSLKLECPKKKFEISIQNWGVKRPVIKKLRVNGKSYPIEKFKTFSDFIARARRVDMSTPQCRADNSFSIFVTGSLLDTNPGEDDDFTREFQFEF